MSFVPARTEKSWGHELLMWADQNYTCKHLVYTHPGIASSLHFHRDKHETFTILRGYFEIEKDGVVKLYQEGDVVVIPPFSQHRVRFLKAALGRPGDGVIVEASSYDDPRDCVRLEPSESPQ